MKIKTPEAPLVGPALQEHVHTELITRLRKEVSHMKSKLIAACMALAAFVAFAVMPAAASASPELTHPTGTTLPVGTSILATNTTPTKFTSAFTEVTCSTATMTGKVAKNSGTEVEGEVTSATFSGTGAGGDCTSGAGDVKVTANPATNGLPWCLRSTKTADQFEIRGGACSAASRPIRFGLDFTSGLTCVYQRTGGATGTFATHPEDAVLKLEEASWPLLEGGFLCPSEGKLDLTFTLETDTATADPIYIS
jgi:hypothetical protein